MMDLTSVLKEVDTWPVEDRIRLMDAVWDGLVDAGVQPALTNAQRRDLDRRIADADANPGEVFSSEDVQSYARERS